VVRGPWGLAAAALQVGLRHWLALHRSVPCRVPPLWWLRWRWVAANLRLMVEPSLYGFVRESVARGGRLRPVAALLVEDLGVRHALSEDVLGLHVLLGGVLDVPYFVVFFI